MRWVYWTVACSVEPKDVQKVEWMDGLMVGQTVCHLVALLVCTKVALWVYLLVVSTVDWLAVHWVSR